MTYAARGLARKVTTLAYSCGVPYRPIGIVEVRYGLQSHDLYHLPLGFRPADEGWNASVWPVDAAGNPPAGPRLVGGRGPTFRIGMASPGAYRMRVVDLRSGFALPEGKQDAEWEDPDSIIDDIEAGMHGTKHERVTDRLAAIQRAIDLAEDGDIVLLAGKGHEKYQDIGGRTQPFDVRRSCG